MAARTAPDPRRAAANVRLHRMKRTIAAMSAVLGLTIWSLVAGSVASATVPEPPSTISAPQGTFFEPGTPMSVSSETSRAPVLRSGGS